MSETLTLQQLRENLDVEAIKSNIVDLETALEDQRKLLDVALLLNGKPKRKLKVRAKEQANWRTIEVPDGSKPRKARKTKQGLSSSQRLVLECLAKRGAEDEGSGVGRDVMIEDTGLAKHYVYNLTGNQGKLCELGCIAKAKLEDGQVVYITEVGKKALESIEAED